MHAKTLPHDHGHLPKGLQTEMPQAHTFEILSDLFKMMSDSKRIQIFWLLCHCEECVMNISALVEMSSPAVSHHLKLLKAAGLQTVTALGGSGEKPVCRLADGTYAIELASNEGILIQAK